MNLRKRLLVSNVVMVAVPVAVECAVLGAAAILFWNYLTDVRGIGADQASDLLQAGSVLNYLGALYGDETVKVALIVAAVVMVALLVASVLLTNRFCTRFMLDSVSEPLDELARAAESVGAGNLDARLNADRDDEFGPVFSTFNAMARKLGTAAERERAAETQRTAIVSGLGHDLRTPLTCVKSYAEGLLDGVAASPEQRERYLRTIVAKADEMSEMTERLLDAARIGRHVDVSALPVVDMRNFIDSWVSDNASRLEDSGVLVVWSDGGTGDGHASEPAAVPATENEPVVAPASEPALPANVCLDGTLMRRILDNLASNCARYARRGDEPCHMAIALRQGQLEQLEHPGCPAHPDAASTAGREAEPAHAGEQPSRTFVEVRVSDDGPGVGAGDLQQIFELFYRGDSARSNPGEGNGIGLAVVTDAVSQMGGSAKAEQGANGGLVIVLTFPMVIGSEEA